MALLISTLAYNRLEVPNVLTSDRRDAVELPSGDLAKDRGNEDGTWDGARDGRRTQMRTRVLGGRLSLLDLALRTAAFQLALRHHGLG
ncbi:hypothetical protein RBK60_19065 [Pseudomonas aeruginosa]|uniref:hypothetical protein n=1 Tax=Pseudomonas aeruginosa TaxID=287 RepID=UPI000F81A558|nr:hypothetical protein [Pseudomonas aeruginosa]MCY4797030.1 hypothetical protein [Pseudomonas aeruginosa]MDZ5161811.1 hypothetical protein [Pseudomonas aeruginosa]MDZ5173003.1 hypothetical protein [Pseudomonas aeruginosa]MDZ5183897.1 hypothetical protein [Pseudomonas aeruginosa]MDZ5189212.1 hypothetical protein [Pseudomonas aeruginosa]